MAEPALEPTATSQRKPWDAALTAGLLAVGLYGVLTSIPTMANLPATLQASLAQYDYGDYTNVALASAIGIAINVVQVVLLGAAIALSIRSLRRGKLTFWIPLVFGVVANVVMIILFSVAIVNDPGFSAWIAAQQPQ